MIRMLENRRHFVLSGVLGATLILAFGATGHAQQTNGAPKPTSSVMMSRMLGAPFGGTTRAGHAGLDWAAFRPISPWKGCGGAGR